MPATDKDKARNPDRFYCPYPGCNRSFAELWRLKVHYRAPPDVRGSGKERGHGTELDLCPKCGKDLKPGKHHVGCSAGRSAPRQAAKRVKAAPQEGQGDGHGGIAIGAPVMGYPVAHRPDIYGAGPANGAAPAFGQRGLDHRLASQPVPMLLPAVGGMLLPPSFPGQPYGRLGQSSSGVDPGCMDPVLLSSANVPFAAPPGAEPLQPLQPPPQTGPNMGWAQPPLADAGSAGNGNMAWLGGGGGGGAYNAPPTQPTATSKPGEAPSGGRSSSPPPLAPSPPPLPSDWEPGPRATGLLFDFDLFNVNRPAGESLHEQSRPFVTVTTAMNPADMACPSDDYIMQILFGEEESQVPRRMTTHLHHFESMDEASGSPFGDMDKESGAGNNTYDVLDSLLAGDTSPHRLSHSGNGAAADQPSGSQQAQQQLPVQVQHVPREPSSLAASVAATLPLEHTTVLAQQQGPVAATMGLNHKQQTLTVPH